MTRSARRGPAVRAELGRARELGATNSNNALTSLGTINGNGALDLQNGVMVQTTGNLTVLEDLCHTMKFGSLCALGGFTPYPVMSALTRFPEDFGAAPRLQAAE